LMPDFVMRVGGVDWANDSTQRRDRMKRHGILRAVWAQDAENVAFAEAARGEVVGRDTDLVGELCVSDNPAGWPVNQSRLVAELFGAVQHERRQRGFGDRDVWIGAFDDHVVSVAALTGLQDLHDYLPNHEILSRDTLAG